MKPHVIICIVANKPDSTSRGQDNATGTNNAVSSRRRDAARKRARSRCVCSLISLCSLRRVARFVAARGRHREKLPPGCGGRNAPEAAAAYRRPRLGRRFMKDDAFDNLSTSAMCCEASSIVALLVAAIALEPAPHPIGGIGSSEAVVRPAAANPERLMSALGSETRVFCPAESLTVARSRNSVRSSASPSHRSSAQTRDAVEQAEHLSFAEREPHRHFDIGTFEIHPVAKTR